MEKKILRMNMFRRYYIYSSFTIWKSYTSLDI